MFVYFGTCTRICEMLFFEGTAVPSPIAYMGYFHFLKTLKVNAVSVNNLSEDVIINTHNERYAIRSHKTILIASIQCLDKTTGS